ncbi:MAG TPA: type III-A CRISPR-associated RAMP protein Csm4 [Anaerolineae bacterium]|nr:type III-A CRISPR-associated RAMP protein Csm4 [Anaerolineae bacterium]HQK14885.1 type III-A CRISPR-associated RAMP protein Csm4 [Anaerolineae bacterium]
MPALTVYRLTFPGGLHVGERGVNLEESRVSVPSDTLFAALVDACRRDNSDPVAFVKPFLRGDTTGKPPFLLTSAFPFAGEVRFFPMPTPLQRFFDPRTLKNRRKDIQKIRYVSESLWRRMLDGEKLDGWLFPEDKHAEPKTGVALQGETLWLTLQECQALPSQFRDDPKTGQPVPPRALHEHQVYADVRVPRVTVNRINSASTIFHAGRVTFAPGCGLWFGVEWRAPEARAGNTTFEQVFHKMLALLGDDGLGGERTTGYGAFRYERGDTLSLPDARPGGLALLMSRYHPRNEELPAVLNGEGTAYTLDSIAGWLRSWDGAAQRRKRLWLVSEGSVIRTVGDGPWGDVTDVRPDYDATVGELPHPVCRYGLALAVGLKEA